MGTRQDFIISELWTQHNIIGLENMFNLQKKLLNAYVKILNKNLLLGKWLIGYMKTIQMNAAL